MNEQIFNLWLIQIKCKGIYDSLFVDQAFKKQINWISENKICKRLLKAERTQQPEKFFPMQKRWGSLNIRHQSQFALAQVWHSDAKLQVTQPQIIYGWRTVLRFLME